MALPPLQNLLDLLPDNTQGLIEPVDLRSITTDLYEGILGVENTLTGFVRTDGAVTMDDGYSPSALLSVATKEYVDSILFPEDFVQKSGSTMTGDLFLPLYLPTEYTQAAHKGYVDSAISSFVNQYITTNTTNFSLITTTPTEVIVKGLRAGQNVQLTNEGEDIAIKASVEGTGGDVRTDISNEFDLGTTQTFDKAKLGGASGYDLGEAVEWNVVEVLETSDAVATGSGGFNDNGITYEILVDLPFDRPIDLSAVVQAFETNIPTSAISTSGYSVRIQDAQEVSGNFYRLEREGLQSSIIAGRHYNTSSGDPKCETLLTGFSRSFSASVQEWDIPPLTGVASDSRYAEVVGKIEGLSKVYKLSGSNPDPEMITFKLEFFVTYLGSYISESAFNGGLIKWRYADSSDISSITPTVINAS